MNELLAKATDLLKKLWIQLTVPADTQNVGTEQGTASTIPSPGEARLKFRAVLTDYVADGWNIEIENEFDAVLSKRPQFRWVGKLIIFLILLLIFVPLALFYLIVIIVQGVTIKPRRMKVWVDELGQVQIS